MELRQPISLLRCRRKTRDVPLAPSPHPLNVRGRMRRRGQSDAEPFFMSLMAAEPDLGERWNSSSYRTQTTYLNWMAAAWRTGERHRRAKQAIAILRADALAENARRLTWWDALSELLPL
jgi:hypothetical protein